MHEWSNEVFKHSHEGERAEVDDDGGDREPFSHGLTVLPFLRAERSPGWNDEARGAITGISQATTAADMRSAILSPWPCRSRPWRTCCTTLSVPLPCTWPVAERSCTTKVGTNHRRRPFSRNIRRARSTRGNIQRRRPHCFDAMGIGIVRRDSFQCASDICPERSSERFMVRN